MCFFIATNLSAEQVARMGGRNLDLAVVEKARRVFAEQERLFIKEQEKLPVAKRRNPKFFDFHIAENVYIAPAYSKPQQLVVGPDRNLQVFRWGLKPRNASPGKLEQYAKGNWFVNANGERIFSEKTYPYFQIIQSHYDGSGEIKRQAQRCLIPFTGFVEYHYFSDKDKQPYYIEFPDRPECFVAGLYEVTPIPGKAGYPGGGLDLSDPDYENYYYTYVQVTTEGTPEMRELHNGGNNPFRMPMVLRKEDEQLWLDPSTPLDVIKSLIKPYDEYPIKAWPIDKKFQTKNPLAKLIIEEVKLSGQKKLDL